MTNSLPNFFIINKEEKGEINMNINELPTITLSSRAKDLTNKRQGKLIFLKPAEKQSNRIFWWV